VIFMDKVILIFNISLHQFKNSRKWAYIENSPGKHKGLTWCSQGSGLVNPLLTPCQRLAKPLLNTTDGIQKVPIAQKSPVLEPGYNKIRF
jgi:hypothetical protein